MGSNQFRKYAAEIPSGFKCEFCSEECVGNYTSFLCHLAKIDGNGVNICPAVSENVSKEAYSFATTVEISSRKQVHFPPEECPSSKSQSIQNSTSADASIGNPIPFGIQNDQTQNGKALGNYVPVLTMGAPLLVMPTEIVGEQLKKYTEELLSSLIDDGISKVGTLGVGGVGKTEVAKSINNLLLSAPNKFHHAFWVNVSRNCRIHKLQTVISKAVGVDRLDGDDEYRRAAQLFKVPSKKENFVVILDDVWDYISLQEVGIPLRADQGKVVITTRSFEVCRQFGCQSSICIGLLSQNESYQLYRKILGKETRLSEEGEMISKSIVDKCGGLPLAVIITARNMRGITNVQEMRTGLNGCMRKKADAEIFHQLKLSYHYLKDSTLQQCFFYVAHYSFGKI